MIAYCKPGNNTTRSPESNPSSPSVSCRFACLPACLLAFPPLPGHTALTETANKPPRRNPSRRRHRSRDRVGQSLLTQLKILMTTFDSLPPMGVEGPNAARERTLARDVMEVAVFLSARDGDSDAFQRHMAQVGKQAGCLRRGLG